MVSPHSGKAQHGGSYARAYSSTGKTNGWLGLATQIATDLSKRIDVVAVQYQSKKTECLTKSGTEASGGGGSGLPRVWCTASGTK